MKDLLPEEYADKQRCLAEKYRIDRNHAGCYLINFEHDYICHKLNGGCNNIRKCQLINKLEDSDSGDK